MSANSKSNTTQTNAAKSEQEVDVLYQKLGDKWFAFSVVGDDVFMSPVSDDQINDIKTQETPGLQNEAA